MAEGGVRCCKISIGNYRLTLRAPAVGFAGSLPWRHASAESSGGERVRSRLLPKRADHIAERIGRQAIIGGPCLMLGRFPSKWIAAHISGGLKGVPNR
jgi:hypothetical protein